MWKDKTVSVILPTHTEKDTIAKSIQDYFDTGFVDEIIVVNNNATPGTKEIVDKTRARQVFETRQGYGYAIQKGINEAKCDLIVISEPDGTFRPRDIIKLLVYSDDYDTVWGTRTDLRFIEKGANMGIALRFGNYFVAKALQLSFNTTRLTDMGCTFKLYRKEALDSIKGYFGVGGSHFSAELMVLTALEGFNIIEVPVNYSKRVGRSTITGCPLKALIVAFNMITTILRYFIKETATGNGRR